MVLDPKKLEELKARGVQRLGESELASLPQTLLDLCITNVWAWYWKLMAALLSQ